MTKRAVHIKSFNAEGRHGGSDTARDRADWGRAWRDARERAGQGGTILVYAASVDVLTGKLVSVAASPMVVRAAA